MLLSEQLMQRAEEARERAESLRRASIRMCGLARLLRDLHAGETQLVRCAWCGSVRVGREWLRLDEIGSGDQRIEATLVYNASHGICPRCLSDEIQRANQARAERVAARK